MPLLIGWELLSNFVQDRLLGCHALVLESRAMGRFVATLADNGVVVVDESLSIQKGVGLVFLRLQGIAARLELTGNRVASSVRLTQGARLGNLSEL